jgi:L,D-peptidoglycan transpeptidase YkuD (ErfK/YbiS/YcfS/YnhG family)
VTGPPIRLTRISVVGSVAAALVALTPPDTPLSLLDENDSMAASARTTRTSSEPAFATRVPASTTQVVRTISTKRWCTRVWCTVTQAWHKGADGHWVLERRFRSSIGPNGFGKRHEGDRRSPSGVYRIRVTFSTGSHAPGEMPWKRRLPTSIVSGERGRLYNTWVEEPGRTDGDRPAMRWGFVVGYNHPRLRPGVGPKPVAGKGSGIFYHTSSSRAARWDPTEGCTQLGRPRMMRWLVSWLDADAHPRVVQNL